MPVFDCIMTNSVSTTFSWEIIDITQVFISYSRKDLRFVEQLAADLKNAGFNVCYDVSGIGGRSPWRFEIENALRKSQCQFVVYQSADPIWIMDVESSNSQQLTSGSAIDGVSSRKP